MGSWSKDTFIYELLLAYGLPKATVTRAMKGTANMSKERGVVQLKSKVLFKPVQGQDLHVSVEHAAKQATHKERFVIVTDFKTLLAKDMSGKATPLETPFEELHKHPVQQRAVEEPPEAGFPLPAVGELLPPELIADAELDRHAYPPWLTPDLGHYIVGTGRPEYFTRIQNYLCFFPISDQVLDNKCFVYMYHFDGPLDSANPYTSTLQDAYPAYLYGALSHAEGYLMNDPRIQLWKSKFEECLAQMNGTKTDADLGSVQEVQSVYA